jgi:hypothetical protein
MDIGLSELCKKVYELTGWDDKSSNRRYIIREIGGDADLGNNTASYYTSDYLLEKLPMYIVLQTTPTGWEAWHENNLRRTADTPLKALLKLVIALCEAGEIKRDA